MSDGPRAVLLEPIGPTGQGWVDEQGVTLILAHHGTQAVRLNWLMVRAVSEFLAKAKPPGHAEAAPLSDDVRRVPRP